MKKRIRSVALPTFVLLAGAPVFGQATPTPKASPNTLIALNFSDAANPAASESATTSVPAMSNLIRETPFSVVNLLVSSRSSSQLLLNNRNPGMPGPGKTNGVGTIDNGPPSMQGKDYFTACYEQQQYFAVADDVGRRMSAIQVEPDKMGFMEKTSVDTISVKDLAALPDARQRATVTIIDRRTHADLSGLCSLDSRGYPISCAVTPPLLQVEAVTLAEKKLGSLCDDQGRVVPAYIARKQSSGKPTKAEKKSRQQDEKIKAQIVAQERLFFRIVEKTLARAEKKAERQPRQRPPSTPTFTASADYPQPSMQ